MNRVFAIAIQFAIAVLFLAGRTARSEAGHELTFVATTNSEPTRVEVQGKVVCLPEAMHTLYGTELPTGHTHVYGFQTNDGSFYTLLRTKYSEALFADERVRQRQLRLMGRLFPKTHLLEVTRIRSVREDVVYDLFYYCSVCHIESVSPGPCECCQGPVELTEKPLRKKS
jgi:hypothetical protein